jgi:hypothetical protein
LVCISLSFHTRDVTIVGALSDLKGALDELGFAGAGLVGPEVLGTLLPVLVDYIVLL